MQVFKAFFTIAKKRLNAAFIYFIIYAIITVLMSATASDTYSENFQATALSITIADEDNTTASRALTDYLSSIHSVTEYNGDEEKILDQIYYRTLDYALTIPAGFEDSLLAGDTTGLLSSKIIPQSTRGHYVKQQITQYLQTLQLYLAGNYTLEDAISHTNNAIASIPVVKTISFHAENANTNSNVFYFFQYLPYIFIVMLFSGMAPILVTMNQNHMKERTACSALPSLKRTQQLSLGCLLYSLGIWTLFLILLSVLYRTDMVQVNTPYAILNSFVFLLFSTAVTLLVSCFSPDDNTINMMANIIGMGMAFACGVFVPQSMLPDGVLSVAKFLPAYWYIRANNMLAGFGKEVFDIEFYWICIGIQLLFTAAVFAVAMVFAKQRRKH